MPRVLIVEDNHDLREFFAAALSLEHFRVTQAAHGLDALQRLDSDPPDLIVLDLGLPFLSGHAVLEELTGQAHLRNIPVVIVTGGPVGLTPGAACILRKPVTREQLVKTVRRCLATGSGAAGC